MNAQQAEAALRSDPTNAGAALALVKSQLQAGQDAAARQTLADAAAHSRDPLPVEMTAADIAVQIGRYDAAFAIYSQALEDAIGKPPYPAVRITAGEYLYTAATLAGRLTLAQAVQLSQDLKNNSSPIVSAMIGRALLAGGRTRLAETAIANALNQDSTLPEAHLVNGELKLAKGDQAGAKAEWQLVLDSPDAPDWLRNKATELMNSLN